MMLVTMNRTPSPRYPASMGGYTRQIVREIDALGGYSGIVTDHTMVQFRMLNRS